VTRWLAVATLLVPVAAHAQNWPSFRGPNASGVALGRPTATTWDATKASGVLWKTEIPGLAVSSPIVWGETVFVTTAVSSDANAVFRHGLYGDVEPSADVTKHSWRVLAIDKQSGKVKWDQVAHEGIPKTKRHPKSSQASCTPVTDGKVLIAYFASEGLYAYDFAGKLLWKQDLGRIDAGWFFDPDYEWGAASSPVIYKDLVIVQADRQKDSFIAAYRLKDGTQAWRTERDEIPSWGSPTVYQGPPRDEVVTHGTKFIRAYDPATGKELWRAKGLESNAIPTPVAGQGIVILSAGYPAKRTYAVKLGGSGDVSGTANVLWKYDKGSAYVPSPILYGDYLYLVTDRGILTCLDAKTGAVKYEGGRVPVPATFTASPVAFDGKILLTSEDGDTFVIKAGPAHEVIRTNSVGEPVYASPAISDGKIFIRGEKNLYCIGK
jgi:outer membrane protein assembly factor BamB